MLTLTWQDHHRTLQADQLIAYDDGDTGREDGQQTVVEWRFGPSSTGPWGAPTTNIVTAPQIATYDPPGDGWVQVTCYSIRDGLVSWQAHVGVALVVGGDFYVPGNRITDAGDRRITDAGDVRVTE
jgi:hypothetical protein